MYPQKQQQLLPEVRQSRKELNNDLKTTVVKKEKKQA